LCQPTIFRNRASGVVLIWCVKEVVEPKDILEFEIVSYERLPVHEISGLQEIRNLRPVLEISPPRGHQCSDIDTTELLGCLKK
jgi:hypothetical protein